VRSHDKRGRDDAINTAFYLLFNDYVF